MLYKPSFCCHCGEKIERVDWNVFTSRRFCGVCESENKTYDLVPRVIMLGAFLLALFGAGGYIKKSGAETPQKAALLQQSKKPTADDVKRDTVAAQNVGQTIANQDVNGLILATQNAVEESGKQPGKQKILIAGSAFYCGATTKKGTPCTRKVKTKGYCWQHTPRPPMLITSAKTLSGN